MVFLEETSQEALNIYKISGHVVRASPIRHRNALTETAWEDVVQGLGLAKD